jgi:hypothetical protein
LLLASPSPLAGRRISIYNPGLTRVVNHDAKALDELPHHLLVGQLSQGWQVKAANLRTMVDQAATLLQAFGRCDLVEVPRDEIVRVLGH